MPPDPKESEVVPFTERRIEIIGNGKFLQKDGMEEHNIQHCISLNPVSNFSQ